MRSLPQIIHDLWGRRSGDVTIAYRDAFEGRHMVLTDLAAFCNIAAPIEGASEFDRGVAEGKRRVFLHIARVCRIKPSDFPKIQDGDEIHDR